MDEFEDIEEDDSENEVSTNDMVYTFQVNALNGEAAYWLALDNAGNFLFENDADFDMGENLSSITIDYHPLAKCTELGGYEISVVRRGYSRAGGNDFHSDYAVSSMDGPYPLYPKPDIFDRSPKWAATLAALNLEESTTQPAPDMPHPEHSTPRRRL